MLSYQHMFHAGNLADVHKHYLLASVLEYLTRKDKPLTYIETHAGRGLYDLSDAPALKTGEAAAGIQLVIDRLWPEHPYAKALKKIKDDRGESAYPGSPLLAASLLRPEDHLFLAELHPQEYAELRGVMKPFPAKCSKTDGFAFAHSICPPTRRRGLVLIDPSWEIKSDYNDVPRHIAKITKAWNTGMVLLWYPILEAGTHLEMVGKLENAHSSRLRHEVAFPPARKGQGMIGSGMFIINPPFGLEKSAAQLTAHYKEWFPEAQKSLT